MGILVFRKSSDHIVITMKALLMLVACLLKSSLAYPTANCNKACDKIDLSLVIDNSQTVTTEGFEAAKDFLIEHLKGFKIGPENARVSVITYGYGIYTDMAISFDDFSTSDALVAAIKGIEYRHGIRTDTGAAIDYMLDSQMIFARPDAKRVIVVLTDGDSQDKIATKKAADRARKMDIAVYAIGVGPKISREELHMIATDGTHVIPTPSYLDLNHILNQLKVKICNETPEPVCRHSPTELMFVIDSSASVNADGFQSGLTFIQDFLESFEINPSTIRVAAVMYGDRAFDEDAIFFDDYRLEKDVAEAIGKLPWMKSQWTSTGDGIDFMVDNFLPKAREYTPKVAIVITDGESQDKDKTIKAAQNARDHGVKTVAVGVGRARTEGGKLNMEELRAIAGIGNEVIMADSYADLQKIRKDLVDETCEQALIAHQEIAALMAAP